MKRTDMTQTIQNLLLVICSTLIGVAGSAHSQTMYRCGKSLQDRPCDIGQPGQAIGRTSAPSEATASTSADRPAITNGDAQCAQRGIDAQKIKWEREAGMTEQAQLSSPKYASQRQLISEVYQRQGSAPQIRAAVEADCIKEKERRAQAAALIDAAAKLLPQTPTQPSAPPVAAISSGDLATKKVTGDDSARLKRCANFQQSADSLRDRQRRGGTISTMDALNREQRILDKDRSEAGC